MFFSNINILTTLIATVVGVAIGFAWHAQWAFGKIWIREMKASNPHWEHKARKSMMQSNTMIVVSTFITAFVLAGLFNSLLVTGISGIICAAVVLWLGLMVPMKLADYLFGADSFKFFLITVGYSLVEVVVMSLIIGLTS